MKKYVFFFTLFIATYAVAQQGPEPGPFAVVNYFKVEHGKGAAYIKMEKELWKPVHQARKKSGDILAWYCFSVNLPGNKDYNFVAVTIYDNLAKLDNFNFEAVFKAVHPQKKIEDVSKETTDARVEVRTEISRRLFAAIPKNNGKPSPMIEVSFFRATSGNEESYPAMVKNILAPVFKEQVDNGKADAFSFWEVWFPNGAEAPYNFVGVGGLPNYAALNLGENGFSDAFKKTNPSLDQSEILKTIRSKRDRVKTEIWSLVDYVE
jgi:hypothetical protein